MTEYLELVTTRPRGVNGPSGPSRFGDEEVERSHSGCVMGGGTPGAPLCPLPAQGQAAAFPPAERGERGSGDYAQVSGGGVTK